MACSPHGADVASFPVAITQLLASCCGGGEQAFYYVEMVHCHIVHFGSIGFHIKQLRLINVLHATPQRAVLRVGQH